MKYGGALPVHLIKELINGSFLEEVSEKNIRPASLDTSLTDEVYRVQGAFLPAFDEDVYSAIKRAGGIPLYGEKKILERGVCYVVKLNEKIKRFPRGVYAYCNPKSSSGRVDLHVRHLVDRVSRYDLIPEFYSGPMWLMLVPKTFPVIISDGLALNQIRFFNEDTRLDEMRMEIRFSQDGGLVCDESGLRIRYEDVKHRDNDGSILLTLGLNFPISGYEAIENGMEIDLSLIGHYDPHYFFRKVKVFNESITLRSETFYILSTKERVRVPSDLACEMRPMDERSGDLRSHYAGFIDPGWGIGPDEKDQESGRTLTLEVRSFDNGIIIRDGQPIAKIRYEKMIEKPPVHYDQMSPTYGNQNGPKLGKYFKNW